MSDIAQSWPPAELVDAAVVVRASRPSDRPGLLRLFSDDQVGRYVGGAQDRNHLESMMPPHPGDRPGFFVIEKDGEVAGIVTIDPLTDETAGQAPNGASARADAPAGVTADFGYMLLPEFWGQGIATRAGGLIVRWWDTIDGGHLAATAQVANTGSVRVAEKLGFVEEARFEQYGAMQWRGLRASGPRGR